MIKILTSLVRIFLLQFGTSRRNTRVRVCRGDHRINVYFMMVPEILIYVICGNLSGRDRVYRRRRSGHAVPSREHSVKVIYRACFICEYPSPLYRDPFAFKMSHIASLSHPEYEVITIEPVRIVARMLRCHKSLVVVLCQDLGLKPYGFYFIRFIIGLDIQEIKQCAKPHSFLHSPYDLAHKRGIIVPLAGKDMNTLCI